MSAPHVFRGGFVLSPEVIDMGRAGSIGGVGSGAAISREEAARRAAEQAAERARVAAAAAQARAAAAQKKAEASEGKYQDALQRKPRPSDKELSALRDRATADRQAAIAAGQTANTKDREALAAEKIADGLDQQAGVKRPFAGAADLSDDVRLSELSSTQASKLLGRAVPGNVAAADDARFVTAAAKAGNGADALASSLARHADEPEYQQQLLAQSRPAVEDDVRAQLQTDPNKGAASLKTFLSALPAAERTDAVEALKGDVAAAVTQATTGDRASAVELYSKLIDAAPDESSRAAFTEVAKPPIDDLVRTPELNDGYDKAVEQGGSIVESTQKLTEARTRVEELNKKLNQQLARLGPGLTAEQKKAYIQQFREVHADEYGAEKTAAENLAAKLKTVSAETSDPAVARQIVDAAKVLADSPAGAEAAKDFATELSTHPDSPLCKALGGAEQVDAACKDIVAKAMPHLYEKALQESNGDTVRAAEELERLLKPLEASKTFSEDLPQLKKGLEALKKGDFDALATIDKNNPLGNALKAAGVIMGITKLVQGPNESATAYLKALADTGKDGAELLAQGLKVIGKGLQDSPTVEYAEKIGKVLGPIASLLGTATNIAKAQSADGNAADVVAAAGDALATVGGVLSATGVLIELGAPLVAAGTAISTAGSVTSDVINDEKTRAEERDLMQRAGVDPRVIDTMMDRNLAGTNVERLQQLADKTGMSGDQIQQLILEHPELANPNYLYRFTEAATASGLKGDDVNKLADALKHDDPDYVHRIDEVGNPIGIRGQLRQYPTARELLNERGASA
jgi:hypothetical protein